MKFSDILIVILVILILGTIGVGVYVFVIQGTEITGVTDVETFDPLKIDSGANKSFSGADCKVDLAHPDNWVASEVASATSPSVEVVKDGYKVVITCNAEIPKEPDTFTFEKKELTIDSVVYLRYAYFYDQAGKVPTEGYVWQKDVSELSEQDLKDGKNRVLSVGEEIYSILYDFPLESENLSKLGKQKFGKYLETMDTITESIKFNSTETTP